MYRIKQWQGENPSSFFLRPPPPPPLFFVGFAESLYRASSVHLDGGFPLAPSLYSPCPAPPTPTQLITLYDNKGEEQETTKTVSCDTKGAHSTCFSGTSRKTRRVESVPSFWERGKLGEAGLPLFYPRTRNKKKTTGKEVPFLRVGTKGGEGGRQSDPPEERKEECVCAGK